MLRIAHLRHREGTRRRRNQKCLATGSERANLPRRAYRELSLEQRPTLAVEGLSGTSMACPHVAGAAALTWAAYADWTHAQVRDRLRAAAEDLGEPGRDSYFGCGLVDAAAAMDSPQ